MAVRFDVPQSEVHALHRRRRARGLLLFAAGIGMMGAGIVGALWFAPLGLLCLGSCIALLFGAVMAKQSHTALGRDGDLSVVVDQGRITVQYGGAVHLSDQRPTSVIREAGRLDFLVQTDTFETVSVPLDEPVLDARIADLTAEGLVVTVPDRNPVRIAGLVGGVIVAVVALLLVIRLVPLLMLGGLVAGLGWLAPDDPETQVLLFFGLAFGLGGPILLYRITRWIQRLRSR